MFLNQAEEGQVDKLAMQYMLRLGLLFGMEDAADEFKYGMADNIGVVVHTRYYMLCKHLVLYIHRTVVVEVGIDPSLELAGTDNTANIEEFAVGKDGVRSAQLQQLGNCLFGQVSGKKGNQLMEHAHTLVDEHRCAASMAGNKTTPVTELNVVGRLNREGKQLFKTNHAAVRCSSSYAEHALDHGHAQHGYDAPLKLVDSLLARVDVYTPHAVVRHCQGFLRAERPRVPRGQACIGRCFCRPHSKW